MSIRTAPPLPLNPMPQSAVSGVFFLRNCPDQLKLDFKAYCAKRNVSMRAKIFDFLADCVEEDGVRVKRTWKQRKKKKI